MRLILLLLHVWGSLHISLSQNVTCSQPPDVAHAQVSEDTKKTEYYKRDVVHFTCETGYISGPTIRYRCTAGGWEAIHEGKCYLKPCVLPEETANGYYQLIKGEEFVFGSVIKYFCNDGYQMVSRVDTRTCLLKKWTNHVPVCEPSTCDIPPVDGQVVVKGLPENSHVLLPDRFLRFSCEAPGKYLKGSSLLVCGKDGQWDKPFPTCEDITCDAEEMHNYLRAIGLPQENEKMKIGHKLQFACINDFALDGHEELTCLEGGQWNAPFPTCSENCRITEVPSSVYIISGNLLSKGQKLEFRCRNPAKFLQSTSEVECLAHQQWSHPFPTCGDPRPCGKPPGLDNGDLKKVLHFEYQHSESVEYSCQHLYMLAGSPYKTCHNGEWVGSMRCLKPCIVTAADMRPRNINFMDKRKQRENKMYASHSDRITFVCTRGKPDRTVRMTQYCTDGKMFLPTCS